MQGDRTLVEGVGYSVICLSKRPEYRKFELSAQGSAMRQTIIEQHAKKREFLYSIVMDYKKIRWIEDKSIRWHPYGIGSDYGYIIMEQRDADDKPTGFLKVVKQDNATIRGIIKKSVEASSQNLTYYERWPSKG